MALATYLRGLLGKSSSAKPIRPSRLNRVKLALETLESRVTPTTNPIWQFSLPQGQQMEAVIYGQDETATAQQNHAAWRWLDTNMKYQPFSNPGYTSTSSTALTYSGLYGTGSSAQNTATIYIGQNLNYTAGQNIKIFNNDATNKWCNFPITASVNTYNQNSGELVFNYTPSQLPAEVTGISWSSWMVNLADNYQSSALQSANSGTATHPFPAGATTSIKMPGASTIQISSGDVIMFPGTGNSIAINWQNIPSAPSANNASQFSLFEYTIDNGAYDVDISNVDQFGFAYTVTLSDQNGNWPSNVVNINRRESGTSQPVYPAGAPQLAQVGVPANTPSIFSAYANQFPSSNPFNLPYSTGQQSGKQVRLVAPHHVLDGTVTVNTSSQNYIDLNTWFDKTLENLFMTKLQNDTTFSYYQTNQTGGSNNGTLWTGKVLDVTPVSNKKPDEQNKNPNAITTQQYLASDGNLKSIDTKWGSWNDTAKQTYKVLQLVGNAYDKSNFPNPTPPQGDPSKLVPGEYEGYVVNIYFPYFTDNTSLNSLTNPDSSTYLIPQAPSWANTNMAYSASEQVFGCNGVFASNVNDPEAISQNLQVALGNIENVIVSSVNRGVAFNSQGNVISANAFAAPIGFSQFPTITAPGNDVYTYYLAGVLPTGQETAVSPPMTVSVNSSLQTSATLNWLPVDTTWCESFKLYRQNPDGSVVLANNGQLIQNNGQVSSVKDTFANKGTTATPIRFYSGWQAQTVEGNQNSNPYSAFLHQNYTTDPNSGVNIGAICYGYPFDDQGSIGQGWSTNISFAASATLPPTIFFDISGFSSTPLVSTTATLSSNNNPSHLNDAVTFTATVSPASGTVAPTGTVSFYDGATLLGTGTLSASGLNAIASFTTSSLTVGAHSITAAYGGSNAFDPSTSGVLTQTVDGAPPSPVATSVVVASNINPSNLGQAVTFAATVTASKGIATGAVNFLDGATVIGSGTLSAQGVATFQTSTLAVGSHSITAAYTGSATYNASTSPAITQTVAPDGPATTATTLIAAPNPAFAGNAVKLTSTVAALRGTQVPTGTVTFLDHDSGATLGSAQLVNGTAFISHIFATAGTWNLVARYEGEASFAESQSPVTSEAVNQPSGRTVSVALVSSVNPSTQGQPVSFTATIQPLSGSGFPTGTVDFYLNGVKQATRPIFNDGPFGQVTSWSSDSLPLGDNSVYAVYSGDSTFDSATSNHWQQTVAVNPRKIMDPADLGPGSYVAGVGNLLAVKPSHGEMQFFQPFPNYNGQITVNTMDRDADGKADTILAAVAGGAAPHVLVIDSNTGFILSSFYAFSQSFLGGVTLAGGPVHLAPTGSATPVVVCGARAGAQPTVAVFDALGDGYGAFFAFDPAYKGGVNVAMSEANAQGNALVVVSSTINTHVKVFDIANVQPSEIASYYTFGSAGYSPGVWTTAGDIDGDGTQELLAGTAGGTSAARMQVYTLLTGNALPGKVIKPFGDSYLGSVRVGLSDYNRDGVLDLLAASGPMAMGTVRAFDFNTLAELESLFVSNVTDGVFIATNFSRADGIARSGVTPPA